MFYWYFNFRTCKLVLCVFKHEFKCFILQIDDTKLMKDHQTGRSAGYGFITVCCPFYSSTLFSHEIELIYFILEIHSSDCHCHIFAFLCDVANVNNVCNNNYYDSGYFLFELFKFSCLKLSDTLQTSKLFLIFIVLS